MLCTTVNLLQQSCTNLVPIDLADLIQFEMEGCNPPAKERVHVAMSRPQAARAQAK